MQHLLWAKFEFYFLHLPPFDGGTKKNLIFKSQPQILNQLNMMFKANKKILKSKRLTLCRQDKGLRQNLIIAKLLTHDISQNFQKRDRVLDHNFHRFKNKFYSILIFLLHLLLLYISNENVLDQRSTLWSYKGGAHLEIHKNLWITVDRKTSTKC